jgi:hypothetical protein
MRTDGSLVGRRWGPISALGPQPRPRHERLGVVGTPTRPWGLRRLPRSLGADDRRRTLFRELLREAEGVPVEFADGESGIVDRAAFPALGYDFWPVGLVVATRQGRCVVPRARVRRIDVREPRVAVAASSVELLERGGGRRHSQKTEAPVGGR